MQSIFRSFVVFLTLALPLSAYAHNRVVVVPLSGDDIEPLSNIVTVAKRNGDFSNPLAAMASITDASASNPYLIVIAPGVYNLGGQLVMKEFVNIAGSGKEVTTLTGSVSSTSVEASALVVAADNVSIEDVKIDNTGTGGVFSSAIFSDGSNINLSNVVLDANNATATAIAGNNGCRYQLNDVDINMLRRSTTEKVGIRLERCRINMQGGSITLRDEGGSINTNDVTGVYLDRSSDAAISNVDMTLDGGNSQSDQVIGFRIFGIAFGQGVVPLIRISDVNLEMGSSGSAFGMRVDSDGGASMAIDSMHIEIFSSAGGQGYSLSNMNTTISNSSIFVSGGEGVIRGISGLPNSRSGIGRISVVSTNVFVIGRESVGIENRGTASSQPMIVRDSHIRADTSIQAQGIASTNRTYVSDSIISGDVVGEPLCDFVFTTDGERLDNVCDVPQVQ